MIKINTELCLELKHMHAACSWRCFDRPHIIAIIIIIIVCQRTIKFRIVKHSMWAHLKIFNEIVSVFFAHYCWHWHTLLAHGVSSISMSAMRCNSPPPPFWNVSGSIQLHWMKWCFLNSCFEQATVGPAQFTKIELVACCFLGNRGTPCYIIIVVVVRKVSRSNDDWCTVFLMRQHCADNVEWDKRSLCTPYNIVRAYMLRYQLLLYIQFKLSLNETQYEVISLFFGRFRFRIFFLSFLFCFCERAIVRCITLAASAHNTHSPVGSLALSISFCVSVCAFRALCVFYTIKIVFTLMMACGVCCLLSCEMVNAWALARALARSIRHHFER